MGAAPETGRDTRDPETGAGKPCLNVASRYVMPLNPLLVRLMAPVVPMGPNGFITVRGRQSGLPRTTGVAILGSSGRRRV
ncbi:MAG TPA: hypothetical protein VIH37_12095 [Candidatus Limnocylindrales bacterium]